MILQSRRFFLSGLIAAPAVIASASLMPLRGVKYDPIVRVQSYPFYDYNIVGEYWSHIGPMSRAFKVDEEIKRMFGISYWKTDHSEEGKVVEKSRLGSRSEYVKHIYGYHRDSVNSDVQIVLDAPPVVRVNTEELIALSRRTIHWGL